MKMSDVKLAQRLVFQIHKWMVLRDIQKAINRVQFARMGMISFSEEVDDHLKQAENQLDYARHLIRND